MVPLVYVGGAIAMIFTALSYVTMSRAFPLAGSVYAYAARGIGESAGFLAGWAILLDYGLLQTVGYVVTAVAIQSLIPDIPRALWLVLLLGINTTINLLGIEVTARMNKWICWVMFVTVGLFMLLALVAFAKGVAGAELTTAPFYRPTEFSPNVIFGALSIAIAAFFGFDAVTTLAEESRGGPGIVGRATLLALSVASIFMVAESYLASLFVLDRTGFAPGNEADGAIYAVSALIGGAMLKIVMVVGKVLVSGLGGVLAAQVATARIIYGMARDGRLPRFLAHVHPKFKVPDAAIVSVAAVNLVMGFVFANQLVTLISMVTFGALSGFLLLHVSVIVHFVWRQRSRDWLRHLLVPVIGFAINGYILLNMAVDAKLAGVAWLAIGVLALIGLKLAGRRVKLTA